MCLSRNKKNNIYPCKSQFYCIKVEFKGVKIILACFRNDVLKSQGFIRQRVKTLNKLKRYAGLSDNMIIMYVSNVAAY